nr:MAG TPA: hypothetical protein [Caudoviricetes sp.]
MTKGLENGIIRSPAAVYELFLVPVRNLVGCFDTIKLRSLDLAVSTLSISLRNVNLSGLDVLSLKDNIGVLSSAERKLTTSLHVSCDILLREVYHNFSIRLSKLIVSYQVSCFILIDICCRRNDACTHVSQTLRRIILFLCGINCYLILGIVHHSSHHFNLILTGRSYSVQSCIDLF